MKNFSFKRNPITSIGAVLFLALSVFMFVLPTIPGAQVPAHWVSHWYVPYLPAVFSVVLALSPDSIVKGANKAANTFIRKDNE